MIQVEITGSSKDRFLRITDNGLPSHGCPSLEAVLEGMHRRGDLPRGVVLKADFLGARRNPTVFGICRRLQPEYVAFATMQCGDRWVVEESYDREHYPIDTLLSECSPR